MNSIKNFACLALLLLFPACGTVAISNVPLKPAALAQVPAEKLGCRVALIADEHIRHVKALETQALVGPDVDYTITTMPNFYLGVLAAHFEEVDILTPEEDLDGFDLAARMEVRKWTIAAAPLTVANNRVEIDFCFEITDVSDGRPVFTDTESAVRSIPYGLPPKGMTMFVYLNQEIVDSAFASLSKKIGASPELQATCEAGW